MKKLLNIFKFFSITLYLLNATIIYAQNSNSFFTKPIRLIVGFAPGGTVDVVGRIIAPSLGKRLGVPILIDNKAGADGIIADEIVARAIPDGQTFLLAPSGHAINATLYKKVPYDTVNDFTPIGLVGDIPSFITVNANLPVSNLKELIDLAKIKKSDLNYASAASSIQLMTDLFNMMAGIEMTRIGYKGGAPAVTAILSNEVQVFFGSVPTVLPHIKSGKLKALAVTTKRRSALAPEIKTVIESGVIGYDATTWMGYLGPKGIPNDMVIKFNAELNRCLQEPEIVFKLKEQGVEISPSTPKEFEEFIRSEIVKWGKVVKASNAQIE